MLPCVALATILLPPPPGAAPTGACLGVGMEVAGRFEWVRPAAALPERFVLPRANLELGLARGPVGARLVTNAARSGGETGYIGIDGESIVQRLQVAEARLWVAPLGLGLAAGLVDDPWVIPGNNAWDLRAQAPGLAEAEGWLEPSDLGATAAWTAPQGWASASLSLTSGEGYRRRERNGGQDLAGSLTLRPLVGMDAPDALSLQLYARDGSQGLRFARDHRLGARATTALDKGRGGVELLRTWGVAGDAALTPWGMSAFGQVEPTPRALGFARVDRIDTLPAADNDDVLRGLVGAGFAPVAAEAGAPAPARLSASLSHTRRDPAARALSGSAALAAETAVWVQLDLRLREAVPLTAPLPFP
jgi:hypothetical protein